MSKIRPTRKAIRLETINYNEPYAYFLTICTKDRKCILSEITENDLIIPDSELNDTAYDLRNQIVHRYDPKLTDIGKVVDSALNDIPYHYPDVVLAEYIIMPNHVHMILKVNSSLIPSNIANVIKSLKGSITKTIGYPIWQGRFYDHVIRNKHDLDETLIYIRKNPVRWYKKYYTE